MSGSVWVSSPSPDPPSRAPEASDTYPADAVVGREAEHGSPAGRVPDGGHLVGADVTGEERVVGLVLGGQQVPRLAQVVDRVASSGWGSPSARPSTW